MKLSTALSALAGASTWSLLEHVIHEQLGHVHIRHRNVFSVEHTKHHATTHYFAPTVKKIGAAALTTTAVGPLATLALGRRRGAAFTVGLVGMYATYEFLHRRAHTHGPNGRYGRWMRKHHFHHHFHNPKVNHGVTSPLWDRVRHTYEAPSQVRVPEKHAMPWLVDPESGEVRPEHANDYVLVKKKKKHRARARPGPVAVAS